MREDEYGAAKSAWHRLFAYVASAGLGPRLIRSVAGSSAVHFTGMVVTFLVGVQLARGLGVEGYGIYGIAMGVISLASIPGEFGLPKLVTREVAAASARHDLPLLFGVLRWSDRACYAISGLVAGATALGAFLFAGESASPVAQAILWGAPIVPLLALANIRAAALQGMHFIVRGQISVGLVRPLLLSALLFLLFRFVTDAAAAQVMALNAVTAAAALVLSHRWLKSRLPRPLPTQLAEHGKQWRASSVPMALADGMRIMHLQFAILLLGILAAATDVGLFRIAASIVLLVQVPITLMNRVTSPVFAELYALGDLRRLQQLCTRTARVMAAAVLALSLPFIFAGEPMIGFIFGADFAPAYTSLVILCAGQVISASFGPNANLLTMTGHERRVTRAMFIALGMNLAVAAVLIPLWSSSGAAFAMVSSQLAWNVLTWLDAKRLIGVQTSLLPPRWGAIPPQAG